MRTIEIIFQNTYKKVDEHKQEIVMKVEDSLLWKEPRITINKNHSYWELKHPTLKLRGKFVEDCLWTPSLYYTGVDEISSFSPTPTKNKGSPFKYYLKNNGELVMWMQVSTLGLSCAMKFVWYPFDIQVTDIGKIKTITRIII